MHFFTMVKKKINNHLNQISFCFKTRKKKSQYKITHGTQKANLYFYLSGNNKTNASFLLYTITLLHSAFPSYFWLLFK